jgi:predicted ester cyclase
MWFTHDPYDPNGDQGLAGMKRTIKLNRTAFPDMRLVVEDQVAEGDKVVTRWRGEMTHLGELGGAAPTGKHAMISGITIDRFEDGKIVEAWRKHGHPRSLAWDRSARADLGLSLDSGRVRGSKGGSGQRGEPGNRR